MRHLLCTMFVAAVLPLHAQTITNATPLTGTLGGLLTMTITTSSAANAMNFRLVQGTRTLTPNSGSASGSNTYTVNFTPRPYDPAGEWQLKYLNNAPYALPVVLSQPPLPSPMSWNHARAVVQCPDDVGFDLMDAVGVQAVASDEAGNTYICATGGDPFLLDTVIDAGAGVIAKLDQAGDLVWLRTLQHTNGDGATAWDLTVWNDTVLYVVGDHSTNAQLVYNGTDTLTPPGQQFRNGFLLRMNTDGELRWHAQQGALDDQHTYAVRATPGGKAIIGGVLSIPFPAEPVPIYAANYADTLFVPVGSAQYQGMYLACYDLDGQPIWARRETVTTTTGGGIIALGSTSNGVVAFAQSTGVVNFDGSCGQGVNNQLQAYVMAVDSTGERSWCHQDGIDNTRLSGTVTTNGETVLLHDRRVSNSQRVKHLRFSPTGTIIQDEFLVQHTPSPFGTLRATPLPDGGYVVAYAYLDRPNTFEHQILLQRYDADGQLVGRLWPEPWSNTGVNEITAMHYNAGLGQLVVAGAVDGTTGFGPDLLTWTNAENRLAFIAWVSLDFSTGTDANMGTSGARVWPVPSTGPVHVSAPTPFDRVEVVDAMGRVVQYDMLAGQTSSTELTIEHRGLCLLRLFDGTTLVGTVRCLMD